jgi:WD40 repeat protein
LNGQARSWDAATGFPLFAPIAHGTPIFTGDLSPDGRWFATGSWDGMIRVHEVRTGAAVGEPMSHRAMITGLRFSPDGRHLFAVSFGDAARLWDVTSGRAVRDFSMDDQSFVEIPGTPDLNKQ